jgi:NADH dehydrogenase FAD-containing subunit
MFDIMTKTHEKMTGGRFTFKRGKLTHVLHKENQIEITSPDGVTTEIIDYDVLCISTGANYCNPWRPDDTLCDTLVDRDEEFAQCRKEMKETPSILCIGAGETGLETAGWMKEHYPDKVIGVAMRGTTILRGVDGAHQVAVKHLQEMDINIHYNTTYTDGTIKYNDTDSYAYYLDCTGLKFNGPTEFFKT